MIGISLSYSKILTYIPEFFFKLLKFYIFLYTKETPWQEKSSCQFFLIYFINYFGKLTLTFLLFHWQNLQYMLICIRPMQAHNFQNPQYQLTNQELGLAEQSKKTCKQIKIGNIQINYENSYSQICQKFSSEKLDGNGNINTKLIQTKQNSIALITKIQIGKHSIQLKDSFQINQKKKMGTQSQSVEEKEKKRSYYLVDRKPYNPIDKNKPKRKLKNSVRNIRRLFSTWIQQNKNIISSELKELIQQKFRKWPNSNSLIKFLIKCQATRQIFKDFMENSSYKLIKNSNIKDKQSHLDAINSYLKLYQKPQVELDVPEQQ